MKITKKLENRVGETMNWLHEQDEHLVTKERAIEAAEFYQELYCRKNDEVNQIKWSVLGFALKMNKKQTK